jgi:hypothetical protein
MEFLEGTTASVDVLGILHRARVNWPNAFCDLVNRTGIK